MALFKMVYVEEGNVVKQSKVRDLSDREGWEQELYRRWKKRRRDRLWEHRRITLENKYYIFGLSIRLALMGFALVSYINVQNDITMRLGHISELEKQVTDLKKDNEVMQKRLSIQEDIIAILDTAREKYGMDYVKKDQLIYYSLEEKDFVDQYHGVE